MIATAAGQAEHPRYTRLYDLPGIERVNVKAHTVEDWNQMLRLAYTMTRILLVAALVMAGAIVFNTVTVNVLERQRELATMRTLGQTRGRLALMMVLENVLVGAGALVPGFLLGTAVAYYVTHSFSSDVLTMDPLDCPASSYATVGISVLLIVALSVLPAIRPCQPDGPGRGHKGLDLGFNHHVEHRRLAGRPGPLQLRSDLRRVLDAPAIHAERPRQGGEVEGMGEVRT